MAIKCRKCNKTIGRADDYINCRKECGANYHLACVNLNKLAVASLKETGLLQTWGCGFCSPFSLKNPGDVSCPSLIDSEALQKLPDFLKEVFTEFSRVVSESFNKLNQQVADLKHENFLLREEIRTVIQQYPNRDAQIPKEPAVSYAATLKSTSALVVKPKNAAQTTTQTKSDLITTFNPENTDELGIARVKSIRNGGVLLNCRNPDELKKLVQNKKLDEKYDIHDVKTPLPRIRISGISDDIAEEMIVPFLLKQNKHIFSETTQCTLLKYAPIKNRQKTFQVILQVDISSYKNALNFGHCLIGLDSCNIYDAVDVIRCYRCNGFNHSVRNCKKNVSCPRCSAVHELKDCKATEEQLQCINCSTIQARDNLGIAEISHACWDYEHCIFYKSLIKKLKTDVFGLSES